MNLQLILLASDSPSEYSLVFGSNILMGQWRTLFCDLSFRLKIAFVADNDDGKVVSVLDS